jgi:hypothetical protein
MTGAGADVGVREVDASNARVWKFFVFSAVGAFMFFGLLFF